MTFFTKLLLKYKIFVMQAKPPGWWKVIRAVLHWLTLPIKLFGILFWTILMQIRYIYTTKARSVSGEQPFDIKRTFFHKIYSNLPVVNGDGLQLYVNRSPYYGLPDGMNHNTDHQAARHGVYAFLMNRVGLGNPKIESATRLHFLKNWGFARGYTLDHRKGTEFNSSSTSGDQLIGLCLAMLNGNPDVMTKELFEQSVVSIIENDYGIIESGVPLDDDLKPYYVKTLLENDNRPEKVKIKSSRAMWQPGLETVGAQALTVLCALRVADVVCNSTIAREHYNKLIYRYGYGLLSLLPTTYAPWKRGYFNDNNCMIAAYILASLSSGAGRKFWAIPMMYVWLLSYKQLNGFFTGLVNDIVPGVISVDYIEKCKNYLYEQEPIPYSKKVNKYETKIKLPVKFNMMSQGEFHPDEEHKIAIGKPEYRSGLGWFAHAVMLDTKEAKQILGRE